MATLTAHLPHMATYTGPADCIHYCSRDELVVLEEHREKMLTRLMAKWQARRLAVGGGIGSGMRYTLPYTLPLDLTLDLP